MKDFPSSLGVNVFDQQVLRFTEDLCFYLDIVMHKNYTQQMGYVPKVTVVCQGEEVKMDLSQYNLHYILNAGNTLLFFLVPQLLWVLLEDIYCTNPCNQFHKYYSHFRHNIILLV